MDSRCITRGVLKRMEIKTNKEVKTCICQACGYVHKEAMAQRTIHFSKTLAFALRNVYKWCREKEVHEFHIRDVRDLMDKTAYTKFSDLVHLGGMVYRPEREDGSRGWYGINVQRAGSFFAGKYKVPKRVFKDAKTGVYSPDGDDVTIDLLPHMADLLDANLDYVPTYGVQESMV